MVDTVIYTVQIHGVYIQRDGMEIDKYFFAARCIAIIIDILYNNEKEAVFYLDLDALGLSENKADRIRLYQK